MLTVEIPGGKKLHIHNLVLDFNGTIAVDGRMINGVAEDLETLSQQLSVYVITADTNGSVHEECKNLPVQVHVIGNEDQTGEKKRFVEELRPEGTIAVGNGNNDKQMFQVADIAIAILGEEGCATSTLMSSDILVKSIDDALNLLLKLHRLKATLRK